MPTSIDQAKRIIGERVELFGRNHEQYRQPEYKEARLRMEFLDPFFAALGWDVANQLGSSEVYKEVMSEDSIRVGDSARAPDYSFRIGGARKFFAEAKKPALPLKTDADAAYQLRRYAWTVKLPLSLLSDFEELAIYDCRARPSPTDKASVGRVNYFTFDQYLDRLAEIFDLFSKEAVLRGSLDQYAQAQGKRGTQSVDAEFLKEIEGWRLMLAKNIAQLNPRLTLDEMNDAVQRTIDRIIFLRMAEDRGTEEYGQLQRLTQQEQIYPGLVRLFRQADDRYNSGLFDFTADTLTPQLSIDDAKLRDLLGDLYFPKSPYVFHELANDTLGNVYEQFLGKVIRLTASHQAKVEEKPEVKKAGGVIYTPSYIGDYLALRTVGNMIAGKSPDQIARLRVIDISCGSGTLLLCVFELLLDYYLNWYVEHRDTKQSRERIYESAQGWRLTTAEKKRILTTHIFGVDIDRQAVEVTKLSLLLKVLEGENQETLGKQLSLFKERALPNLDANIKCGNSLIGTDYFAGQLIPDKEEWRRVNPFDWQTAFPEIMRAGGFDCIIGNPPYVRQELLGDAKKYFGQNYTVYHSIADLYAYFIERGLSLLKPNGRFGFIVANKWMRANYGEPLRRWLKQQRIEEITDFGDLPVFTTATTYPCILILRKDKPLTSFPATQVKTLGFDNLANYTSANQYTVNQTKLSDGGWSLSDENVQALLDKLRAVGTPLEDYARGKVYYGIKTGLNEAFVIDEATRQKLIAADAKSAELIKPFLAGRDVKRYQTPSRERYLILMPRGWTRENSKNARDAWKWLQKNYPAIVQHLSPFANDAEKRYDKGEYWWELRTCDYYAEFEKPKIIVPAIVQSASYAYDTAGFYSNDKTSIIATDDLYLLGVLNSKIPDVVMHSISSTKQGGYFEYKPMYLAQLPIRTINFADAADKARHDRMVTLVTQMLELHKRLPAAQTAYDREMIQRQIDATDKQIDALVYQLYGLTEAEIKVVES